MNETLFNIIVTLIPTLILVISGYALPLMKAKIGNENLITIMKWITYSVRCAEMIFTQEKQGVEKKQYVIDFIENMFNKKKTIITSEQIEVLIESAVRELNKK